MDAADATHDPVLLQRTLDIFRPISDTSNMADETPVILDATVGLGGHAEALLAAFPAIFLIGLDRDTSALDRSRQRLQKFGNRVQLFHAVYDQLGDVLESIGVSTVHGALFDLGVSSMQLDVADRGFAYSKDGPLDMRMDSTAELTASTVVNTYSVGALAAVLSRFGEERFALRIARAIDRQRAVAPLVSTAHLAEVVASAIPAAARRTGGNPAKRTFQALRIEVNQELAVLERAIPVALDRLRVGGRIVVMSYQSLEDRVVKTVLRDVSTDRTPMGIPVVLPDHGPQFTLLTRGAHTPDEQELLQNPRSASVRFRAAERVRAA